MEPLRRGHVGQLQFAGGRGRGLGRGNLNATTVLGVLAVIAVPVVVAVVARSPSSSTSTPATSLHFGNFPDRSSTETLQLDEVTHFQLRQHAQKSAGAKSPYLLPEVLISPHILDENILIGPSLPWVFAEVQ